MGFKKVLIEFSIVTGLDRCDRTRNMRNLFAE